MTTCPTETRATALRAVAVKKRPGRELALVAVFNPLAHALVRLLLPLRVPPVSVVVVNALFGLAAAVFLGYEAFVAAALLLQMKTVLDNADGRLARASGRVTRLGRYLDTEADLVVNVAVFVALGVATGEPWLSAAAFLTLTAVLTLDFNLAELHRETRGLPPDEHLELGGRVERALGAVYRVLFAPQDRLVRRLVDARLERVVGASSSVRGADGRLAYHDDLTVTILSNLGLSTQLLALGVALVLGAPVVYLWLVLASAAIVPLLFLRREQLARRALRT